MKSTVGALTVAIGLLAGGCSSGPSAAERAACSLAATIASHPSQPFGIGSSVIYFYRYPPQVIRQVENSGDAAIASAARELDSAHTRGDEIGLNRAAAKMLSACRQIGL
jgi:hypothetical protein